MNEKHKIRHLNILAPLAKADGKQTKVNRNAFSGFYSPLPSALADGAWNFECQNGSKQVIQNKKMTRLQFLWYAKRVLLLQM